MDYTFTEKEVEILRNLHFPFNCAMGIGMCKICTYHF